MKKNHAQSSTEYMILFAGVVVALLAFFVTGFPTVKQVRIPNGIGGFKWISQIVWQQSPFIGAFTSILKEPAKGINKQTQQFTQLDTYTPWVDPVIDPVGTLTAETSNVWNPPHPYKETCVGLSPNTCTPPTQPNVPPVGGGYCYPGEDYDCHEVWCQSADPSRCGIYGLSNDCLIVSEFDKSCRTAAVYVDTCPGSNESFAYTCQGNDNFTCTDYFSPLFNVVGWPSNVPQPTENEYNESMSPGYSMNFLNERTVTCKPVILP